MNSGKSVAATPASADRVRRDLRISPQVGLAMFELRGVGGNVDIDQGIALGALVDVGEGSTVFQTGLTFFQAGAFGEDQDRFGNKFKTRVSFDYLGLTLGGKHFVQGGQSGIYAKAGLLPTLATRRELNQKAFGQSRTRKIRDISNFDLMANLGLGFQRQLPNTAMDLGVEVGFYRGLTDINKGSGPNIHNQGVMFTGFMSM